MRSAFVARIKHTMIQDSAAEIFVYKTHHSSILYCTAQYFYQTTVAYCIEESLEVKVYYIFVT